MTFKGAELNYPVHENEMLAIIHALQKWHADLVGVPFVIYTDHKTLENFNAQQDLSRQQAQWIEFMSQYNCKIVYVKGADNGAADVLSWTSFNAKLSASCPYPPDNFSAVALIYLDDSSFTFWQNLEQCLSHPLPLLQHFQFLWMKNFYLPSVQVMQMTLGVNTWRMLSSSHMGLRLMNCCMPELDWLFPGIQRYMNPFFIWLMMF